VGNTPHRLDMDRIPRHVAIIMDGNGRWARERGLPRHAGHRAGVDSLRETVKACSELGIEVLSAYVFSTENWGRPRDEVDFLMKLISVVLNDELPELHGNNVKVNVLGRINELPDRVQKDIERAERLTENNTGVVLNLLLNYGGRAELVDAFRKLAGRVSSGSIDIDEIDEETISSCLYTAGYPNPDLVIRTGGENRISNLLLWQIAYAELYVTDTYWPQFRRQHLYAALADFQKRERRFGRL